MLRIRKGKIGIARKIRWKGQGGKKGLLESLTARAIN